MKLSSLVVPPWVKPALAVAALVGTFSAGWTVNGWRWEAKQAAALLKADVHYKRQLAEQNREAEAYEREREAGRVESRARENEIRTIYRDRVVPAECEPDPAAVGVLQRAIDSANAAAGQSGEPVRGNP